MIPVPGERPGQWRESAGYHQAAQEQARLDGGKTGSDDPLVSYYNGVPPELAAEAQRRGGRGSPRWSGISATRGNSPAPGELPRLSYLG